jgi:hypothetical protein
MYAKMVTNTTKWPHRHYTEMAIKMAMKYTKDFHPKAF